MEMNMWRVEHVNVSQSEDYVRRHCLETQPNEAASLSFSLSLLHHLL